MPHPNSGFVSLQSQDYLAEMEDRVFTDAECSRSCACAGRELADHQLSVLVVPKRFELEGLV